MEWKSCHREVVFSSLKALEQSLQFENDHKSKEKLIYRWLFLYLPELT